MSFSGEWNYPSDLPVVTRRTELRNAIHKHQVVVVVSDTGSGKTTQLPKIVAEALDMHGEQSRSSVIKWIGCTQPRRIAAASVARRVAEELSVPLGGFVGYQVRFDDCTSSETRIKFMTDGIMLAETQGDRDLSRYDAIILDEAHERSLNIDFLLGYLKRVLERRPEMKLVISSATLDAGAFADFFGDKTPVIEAAGRMHPVTELFLPGNDDEDLAPHVARGVDFLSDIEPHGDILIFLPGEREIREAAELLEGRNLRNTEVLPLYAKLGMGEQQRIFQPGGKRRLILATNVAETSLTIPRIACVIDSGLARVSRWVPSRGIQRLQVEPVSQASARQRKGRCGRVRDGICLRLYGEEDLSDRSEFTDPEIRRSSLAGVILRMKALGLGEISEFPFIDPPSPKAISEGYRTLREVGALDHEKRLTDMGRKLAKLPLDPRMGRMLLESSHEHCESEVTIIVAGLETSDPRERPAEKKRDADASHARWSDPDSDFISMLNLWRDVSVYHDGRKWRWNQLRKYCGKHFLNAKLVTEWGNVIEELSEISNFNFRNPPEILDYGAIHRSLLAGAPRQFGLWDKENKTYRSASGGFFSVFPGSALFGLKNRNEWVMGLELVETTRLWARRVAKIQPEWVEIVAPHLCRSRYGSAYWDEKQGAVYGDETVICGGLHVIEGRRVHYGRVDKKTAHEVFLREAVIGGGLRRKSRYLERMEALRAEIKELEDKLRRPGMLWSEDALMRFFAARIPAQIFTAADFHKWCQQNEDCLMLSMQDVVWEELSGLEFFPDCLKHEGEEYPVYYRCAPGERDDGVTIGVHVDQLPSLPEWLPEWGIDGNLEQRAELLMRGLPKDYRKSCQPVSQTAASFAELWAGAPKEKGILETLAEYLRERNGSQIPASEFDLKKLPDDLITKIWVCDDDGEELAMGTNVSELKLRLADRMRERFEAAATADIERCGMSAWDGEALSEQVMTAGGPAYPALVDEGDAVGVRAFADLHEALEAHRRGGSRLFILGAQPEVDHLRKNFPIGLRSKIEMNRLGIDHDDLIMLTAEGLNDGSFPRIPEKFTKRIQDVRGRWFDVGTRIGTVLDEIVSAENDARQWINHHKGDRNFGVISTDLDEQLSWLLRHHFARTTRYENFIDLPRKFRAIRTRISRIASLPLAKDLEKLDMIRPLWSEWFERWRRKPDQPALWEVGWLLEEWRIQTFAPELELKFRISQKIIAAKLKEVSF